MLLFSWNINGLRACLNKNGLQDLIKAQQPDILCLQEIKARPEQVDDLSIFEGYNAVWNSGQRKGYSGTLILSKQPPLSQYLNFPQTLSRKYRLQDEFGNTDQEGRVITVEFSDFYLVTVYTPNSKGDLSRLNMRFKAWDPAFHEHCQVLQTKKPILVCGDFNVAHQEIDLARPKENQGQHGFTKEERQGFSRLLDGGLIDSFRHLHPQTTEAYSWWTHWRQARVKNIGWRIDYWLMSQTLTNRLKAATIHPTILGSDHCPVSLTLNI